MRAGREGLSILEGMRNLDRSRQLQQRAEQLLPGGVDSPVRAFRAVGGDPPFVVRAEGAYLWDADGNRYIDYFGSWGPMILGHAFPPAVEAIQQARGAFRQLRRVHCERGRSGRADHSCGAVDREAALRLLRYRGHDVGDPAGAGIHAAQVHHQVRGLLPRPRRWPAGEGRLRRRDASASPVRRAFRRRLRTSRWRCPTTTSPQWKRHSRRAPREIAAIILEPVAGNMGCVPPEPGYLAGTARTHDSAKAHC